MTLIEAQKIVLRSLATEVNGSFFEIYEKLNESNISTNNLDKLANNITDLESIMSYVRAENERISRLEVMEVVNEVGAILKEKR